MFGRDKKNSTGDSTTVVDPKEGGKGRPTPTRREAEAAARERARQGMDKNAAKKVLRERRAADQRKVREGMRTGDERFLPARDQGPVKRFIRDWIDSRLFFSELILPLLVLIMVLGYSGNEKLSSSLWSVSLVLLVIDMSVMLFRLKRALREKFPNDYLKGTTLYPILRVIQLRFMRQPKAKVGLGGKPR